MGVTSAIEPSRTRPVADGRAVGEEKAVGCTLVRAGYLGLPEHARERPLGEPDGLHPEARDDQQHVVRTQRLEVMADFAVEERVVAVEHARRGATRSSPDTLPKSRGRA